MSRTWKIQVLRSWDEVEDPSFVERWSAWIENAPNPHVFFHPALAVAWAKVYRSLHDISPLYVLAENGETKFFLPLVVWKRNWKNAFLRMLIPVGYAEFDYHDPLVTESVSPALLESYWSEIHGVVFQGRRRLFDIVEIPGIRRPGAGEGWEHSGELCPYARLSDFSNYNAYQASLSKRLRKDIVYQAKRLGKRGSVELKRYEAENMPEAVVALRQFLEVHGRKWPNAYKVEGLHEAMLRSGMAAGVVDFTELTLNGQPVSWHFGFCYRKRYYYYMPAYSEELRGFSPGKVHLARLSEEAFRQGMDIFDHLRGEESYKSGWAAEALELHAYRDNASSVLSRLRHSAYEGLRSLREMG